MGLFDPSALPEHLNEKHEIEANFNDDSQFGSGFFGKLYRRYQKATKVMKAFGHRSPKGVAFSLWPPFIFFRQWRKVPILLWAKKGKGYWRFESLDGEDKWSDTDDPKAWLKENPGYYVSRVQYWVESYKALQWPLFYSQSSYKEASRVIPLGTKEDRDGEIDNFYIGAKPDKDGVVWWISAFIGNNFK